MSDLEYSVLFPKEPSEVYFMKNILSFGIEHLKSRLPCSVYFILHLYDENNEEIGHELVHIIDHEEVIEIELGTSVTKGMIHILRHHLADGLCPVGEMVGVKAEGVFLVAGIVDREFSQRGNGIAEADFDIVAIETFQYVGRHLGCLDR